MRNRCRFLFCSVHGYNYLKTHDACSEQSMSNLVNKILWYPTEYRWQIPTRTSERRFFFCLISSEILGRSTLRYHFKTSKWIRIPYIRKSTSGNETCCYAISLSLLNGPPVCRVAPYDNVWSGTGSSWEIITVLLSPRWCGYPALFSLFFFCFKHVYKCRVPLKRIVHLSPPPA